MSNKDPRELRCFNTLSQIIIALKSFEGKFQKKLNFSKLCQYLRLSERDTHIFLQFLLEMQDDFKELGRIFSDFKLCMKQEGKVIYLTAKKIYKNFPEIISLQKEHADWLSDLIYSFQHVKKGKGFDISHKNSILVKHLLLLMEIYPNLFEKNGDKVVYPTQLASELGNLLIKGKKLNRPLEKIKIGDCTIEVVN